MEEKAKYLPIDNLWSTKSNKEKENYLHQEIEFLGWWRREGSSVVEHLSSLGKALRSIPSTEKKKSNFLISLKSVVLFSTQLLVPKICFSWLKLASLTFSS